MKQKLTSYSYLISTVSLFLFTIPKSEVVAQNFALPEFKSTNVGSDGYIFSADFNEDGFDDLAVPYSSETDIYLNDQLGNFILYTSVAEGRRIEVGDFNGDDHFDIIGSASSGGDFRIHLGDGEGNFTPQATQSFGGNSLFHAADFNNDDQLDIAFLDDSSVIVKLGDNANGFTNGSTTIISSGDIIGSFEPEDINRDGIVDLVFAVYNTTTPVSKIVVMLGNNDGTGKGDGTFASVESFNLSANDLCPKELVVDDFNNDNNPDVVTANMNDENDRSISVLSGNGDGSFNASTQYEIFLGIHPPSRMITGDFTGDDVLDIVMSVGHRSSLDAISLLEGDNTGAFKEVTYVSENSRGIVPGDFNSDGKKDVAVLNGFRTSSHRGFSVHLNNEIGLDGIIFNFEVFINDIIHSDFNGDDQLDVVISTNTGVKISFGDGKGNFELSEEFDVGTVLGKAVVGDLNNDTHLDIAIAHASQESITLLLNEGDGTFSNPVIQSVSGRPRSLAIADVDGDDHQDIIYTQTASTTALNFLKGNGSGIFGAIETISIENPSPTFDIQVIDINNDKVKDIIFTGFRSIFTMMGQGAGEYGQPSQVSTSESNSIISIADLNQDGYQDVVAGSEDDISTFLSDENGVLVFKEELRSAGERINDIILQDFNGDGFVDLIASNRDGSSRLYYGDETGSLRYHLDIIDDIDNSSQLSSGDFNNDGRMDLSFSSAEGAQIFGVVLNDYAVRAEPNTGPSDLTFSESTGTSIKLNFTKGNGEKTLILFNEGAPVPLEEYPEDGTPEMSRNTDLDNITINRLHPNRTYHFALISYNGDGIDNNYNTSAVLTGSASTIIGDQIIDFSLFSTFRYRLDSITLDATSNSGLDISYSSSDESVAVIADGNKLVLKDLGIVTITASQAGNEDWNAAEDVGSTIEIVKGNQVLSFNLPPTIPFSTETLPLEASSNAELPVSFEIISGPGTIIGAEPEYLFSSTGVVTIKASVLTLNDLWNPANPVTRVFEVVKGNQTITFEAIESFEFTTASIPLVASTNSGLDVSFTVMSGNGTINETQNSLTVNQVGSFAVQASQEGSDTWNAAFPVNEFFTVSMAGQSIQFISEIEDQVEGGESFPLTGFASSGIPIRYSVVGENSPNTVQLSGPNPSTLVDPTIVEITGYGNVTIQAETQSDVNYFPADTSISFCIVPGKPQIVFQNNLSETELELVSNKPFLNQWYKDGVAIEFATRERYTATENGEYSVRVEDEDCISEFSDSFTVELDTVELENLLGLDAKEVDLGIYPNPTSSYFTLNFTEGRLEKAYLINTTGTIVREFDHITNSQPMLLNSISEGLYLIVAETEDGQMFSGRLLVKTSKAN